MKKKHLWWRFWNEAIDDPKILQLSDPVKWTWMCLLTAASENNGYLPPSKTCAIRCRLTEKETNKRVEILIAAGLLDRRGEAVAPHNWTGRQFITDALDPTASVRKERYWNGKRNGKGTPMDTDLEQ
jgi:hypothetical protein